MQQSAVGWLEEQTRKPEWNSLKRGDIIEQAKEIEQQQQGYSKEYLKSAFKVGFSIGYCSDVHTIDEKNKVCEDWFKQFKKK